MTRNIMHDRVCDLTWSEPCRCVWDQIKSGIRSHIIGDEIYRAMVTNVDFMRLQALESFNRDINTDYVNKAMSYDL